MKLVCDRRETLAILEQCRKAGVALFAPNGELPAEIEGLCMGAQAFAHAHGLGQVPIAIGMTGIYADNPQFRKMSIDCRIAEDVSGLSGGDVRQGCEIWLRHLACYQDLGDTFPAVRVLPFIDHGWAPDPEDREMLADPSVVERMAFIMYDASKYNHEENIRRTGAFAAALPNRHPVSVLPFHAAGGEKYKRLGQSYTLGELGPPEEQRIAGVARLLEAYDLEVRIGG